MYGDTWTVGSESLYVLAGRLPLMCLRVHTVTVGVKHCLVSRCLPGHVQPNIIGQPHMAPRAPRAPFQVILQVSTRALQYGRHLAFRELARRILPRSAIIPLEQSKHILHCCQQQSASSTPLLLLLLQALNPSQIPESRSSETTQAILSLPLTWSGMPYTAMVPTCMS